MAKFKRIIADDKIKDYLILAPDMLPVHFRLLIGMLKKYGYNIKVLKNTGRRVIEAGQKFVHNDACYPALCVIGQIIDALSSGEYDLNSTAVIITQTGGGCRASNYIYLLRKGLESAGFGNIPVLSLNFSGIEKESSIKITLPMILKLQYALFYGDLLMCLNNQVKPYEKAAGTSENTVRKWTERIAAEMEKGVPSYRKIKKNYAAIIADFAAIEKYNAPKVKVGIVGEIYVKFSPVGNNNLESFLFSEGAEVRMGGLTDFCLYCIYNGVLDHEKYNRNKGSWRVYRALYKYICKKQADVNALIEKDGTFQKMQTFKSAIKLIDGVIDDGVKMGEGYLLVAEIMELIESGVKNVICVQPFGCLPNHIIGKGVISTVKEKYPEAQIVAVDYDQSTSETNQQNRIKLMLFNAKDKINK